MPLESNELKASVDILQSPLDDIFIDFLMSKSHESAELDFKLMIEFSKERFAEIVKDIFAMANYGGGYILGGIGEKKTGGFDSTGLPTDFHIDQADLQQKFNSYCEEPIALGYREFEYEIEDTIRKFSIIWVPPSTKPLLPIKDGTTLNKNGKVKIIFRKGNLLFRRGTQSIIAASAEAEFIKQRAEQTDYQISLMSGNPDIIPETLYSNLFEILQIPKKMFSVKLSVPKVPFFMQLESPFSIINDKIYSFEDLTGKPFTSFTQRGSIEKHIVSEWLGDKDHRNIVLWLLDSCLMWEATQRGMYIQRTGKKLFFPLRVGEKTRYESWPGLARKSNRQVATMMYATQLGGTIGVHPAVSIHFMIVAEKLYLRLSPTYVLTRDGRYIRRGEQEGTIITRLSYDDYNKIYLRNLLFWVSKLCDSNGNFRIANGRIGIDPNASKCEIDVGIRADMPTFESIRFSRNTVSVEDD